MPFQFLCPSGHLLQAEPAQSGQQLPCPICQVLMIVPPVPARPVAVSADHADQVPSLVPQPATSPNRMGDPPMTIRLSRLASQPMPDAIPQLEIDTGPRMEPPTLPIDQPPELYHIPCPNGHELETPAEMIGQFVMCPTCNAQFQLAEQDSIEYQRRKIAEREAHEINLGRRWLNRAIAIAILVILGFGTLVGVSWLNQ